MKSPKTIISLLAIMLITTMVAFISSANKNEALQRDLDRMTQMWQTSTMTFSMTKSKTPCLWLKTMHCR